MSGQVRRLALAQVKENFGEPVKKVAEKLLIAPQTLRQLVRTTKLELSQVSAH